VAEASLGFDIFAKDRSEQAFKSAGKSVDGLADKITGLVKTGIAAGVAGGAGLVVGFMESIGREASNDELAAQLGINNPKFAADLGKIAGNLYANNFGDSIGGVNDALRAVWQEGLVLEDAPAEQIEAVTGKALNLAQVFRQDVGPLAAAAGQMIKTGLAKNAGEAFDIITRGFQQGVDKRQDYLDTLNEYGTQFRKLGIDGAVATGILSQGLKAGARDADLVADSLKEFSIRAIDGSELTAEGFRMLGLDGKKMGERIAAGGDSARAALQETLDRVRGIKDPVLQAQAATALFGTQAEDMGAALLAIDPSSATAGLGDMAGAAEKVGDTISGNAQASIETFRRQALTKLTDFVGNTVIPKLQGMGEWFERNREVILPLVSVVGGAVVGLYALSTALGIVNAVLALTGAATLTITWPVILITALIAGLVAGLIYAYTQSETFRKIVDTAFKAVVTAASFMKDMVVGSFRFMVDKWLASAEWIVKAAASAFGWVPGIGGKLKDAARAVEGFRDDVNRALGGIHDREVNISLINDLPANEKDAVIGAMIAQRAVGGPVTAGTPYIVGEKGPELVVPRWSGHVIPNHELASVGAASMAGAPRIGELHVHKPGASAYEVGVEVLWKLKTA
jgi:phage-related minor tail protein